MCADVDESVPIVKDTFLKNGAWAVEPIPDNTDTFCAEWGSESIHIYWHKRELPDECDWCEADLHGNGIELTEYVDGSEEQSAVVCSSCVGEHY